VSLTAPDLQVLAPDEQQKLVSGLILAELERCRQDGWYWVVNHVKTRDEAAGAEESVKAFPDLPQQAAIWAALADPDENLYAIAKSRQIMMSWLCCAFCVWVARFQPNRLVVWQSKREQDAIEMVSHGDKRHDDARMEFIEQALPNWMRDRCWNGTAWTTGRARFGSGEITWQNGSKIMAIPEGGHQIRSKTPSLLILDEAAFMESAHLSISAGLPTIQKESKLVLVSTPNGKQSSFYQMYAGTTEQ
jgi:hypothetical protein